MILTYISAIIMIYGGGYLALLGFGIIKPKKDNPEDQDKINIRRKKFGWFAKFGGIALLVYGILNLCFPSLSPYIIEKKKVKTVWTVEQKQQLMEQIINGSVYLKSINYDTARMVSSCFVDKYTQKYTVDNLWELDKMTQEEVKQISMPILNECLQKYDLKLLK
jgi:hypothetical protein